MKIKNLNLMINYSIFQRRIKRRNRRNLTEELLESHVIIRRNMWRI